MAAIVTDSNGKSIKIAGRGFPGPPGTNGMSAYQYAVAGGYTGTEEEFRALMGSGPWVPVFKNAGAHNSIFRGKCLGSFVTDVQHASIVSGTFDDLFVGDYWSIDGINWRIAGVDYWIGTGDFGGSFNNELADHHLVICPDIALYSAPMNETATAEGGYVGSKLRMTGLEQAKSIVDSAFGSLVLSHREVLCNAVTDGAPSGFAFFDSTLEIPNAIMICGSQIVTPIRSNSKLYRTIDKCQLPLMSLSPAHQISRRANGTRTSMWLRDITAADAFAVIHTSGEFFSVGATYANGVRPVFAIG